VFVWYLRESSWTQKYRYQIDINEFDDYFNWTMTYRLDSDVEASMMPFEAKPYMSYMYKRCVSAWLSW